MVKNKDCQLRSVKNAFVSDSLSVINAEDVRIISNLFVRTEAPRFPFKRNRLRCVRCVNENRKKRKFSRNKRKRQPIGMLVRSSGNHDWPLANASACVSCGFRLRNARNERNASDCV